MRNGWIPSDELQIHYVNDLIHNDNGPALISKGTKAWYQNNRPHRLEGPAVERNHGPKYWYYQGKFIDVKSQKEFERWLKLKIFR